MARRKQLAVMAAGRKYEGYLGFSDGVPAPLFSIRDDYDVPFVELFATRKDARRCYGDVRRVTIVVEEQSR